MADRMGTDTLTDNLESLCREHKAMQAILEETLENWRPSVFHALRSNRIHNAVQSQFREVHENLQSGQTAMTVVDLLARAVDKSLLSGEA